MSLKVELMNTGRERQEPAMLPPAENGANGQIVVSRSAKINKTLRTWLDLPQG
jgi:hypothetical protein